MDAKNDIIDIKPHHPQRQDQSLYQRPDVYQGRRSLHTRIFTSDGKNHLVRGRLSDLDEQLPPNFIRTHRSYITNRNFVKQISKTILFLLDGSTIPISRKFKDLLP